MVDFIKIFYRDKESFEQFVCTPGNFDEVDTLFGLHSGEIKYPYRAEFYSMEVRVTAKHGYVQNSIHKSYNYRIYGETQNHDDFGYNNLCDMISLMTSKIIDLEDANLTQFEFGLNIGVPFAAEEIITQNILMHKMKGANHNMRFNGRGTLKQFDYHNFVVKVYDKAKQYNLPIHILRFEVRYLKAKEFQKFGIYKLHDLKDKTKLRLLFIDLMKRFDELTIVNCINETDIPRTDLEKLTRYNNPYYWENYIPRFSPQTKSRRLKDYQRLLSKYSLISIKQNLRKLLIQKFIHLMNF